MRSNLVFFLLASAIGAIVYLLVQLNGNDYLFFAGYTVVQFIVLATAWNILGGYCGYVNFGSAAFFAVGAYSSVALHKLGTNVDRYAAEWLAPLLKTIMPLNIPSLIIVGGIGSLPGVVVGSLMLIGTPELLREFGEYRFLTYGIVLVIMMRMKPLGLWPSNVRKRELQAADEAAAMMKSQAQKA